MKKLLILTLGIAGYYFAAAQCVPEDIYANESSSAVCYEVVDNVRHVYTNNYPDHDDTSLDKSKFTLATSDTEYAMCAYPEEGNSVTQLYEETETTKGCTYNYTFGVSINGVKYDPSSAEYFENTETGENNVAWHVEARYIFSSGFGNNGGHLNPFGEYHYHDIPTDYFANDLSIDGSEHSPIVGYAADGFPIYYKYVFTDAEDTSSAVLEVSSGFSLKTGTRPGDGISAPDGDFTGLYYEDYEFLSNNSILDECNGRYGVTPDYPYGTYYYVLTDNYPYIPRCFKGAAVDHSFRVGPDAACPESTASTDCAVAVYGCMDPFSTNYNADANVDDGSCTYTNCEVTVSVESQTNITCAGGNDGTITVSSTGFTNPTYSWNTGATTAAISDLSAGTYTVIVTDASCADTLEVTLTESPAITYEVNAIATGCSVESGSLQFTAAGGAGGTFSYSIDGGSTFQENSTFENLSAGTYAFAIKDGSGCTQAGSAEIFPQDSPEPPTVSGITGYCANETIGELTASGAGTFTWYADEELTTIITTGATFTPQIQSSSTFYVTQTANNCESNAQIVEITITDLPQLSITSSATTVCAGDSVTLTTTGADSFSWDQGVTDGVAFVPTETKTYNVTGTTNGCSATDAITITVNALPEITIEASATSICKGESVTLTATGASNISWTGNISNGTAFSSDETRTYTATGMDGNGCAASAAITVAVTEVTVEASATSTAVCAGEPVTLTGSGADSYTWDQGVTDGEVFVPTETKTYNVTGTTNGCSATDAITITVNALPEITIEASAASICKGESVTLTATGASNISWTGNISNGTAFSPDETRTYTATGTDGNGCAASAAITIAVTEVTVEATATSTAVCAGEPVTLTGSGADSYTWDQGVTDGEVFVPTETKTYTVTGTTNGCSATTEITVTVEHLDLSVTLSEGLLQASITDADAYQWIYCDDNSELPNANQSEYRPTQTGSYALLATKGACTVQSECVDFSPILHAASAPLVAVYPNPVVDKLRVHNNTSDLLIVEVMSLSGETLFKREVFSEYEIHTSNWPSGVYLLRTVQGKSSKWMRIRKQ